MAFLFKWRCEGPVVNDPGFAEGSVEVPDPRWFIVRWLEAIGRVISVDLDDYPFDEPGLTLYVEITRVQRTDELFKHLDDPEIVRLDCSEELRRVNGQKPKEDAQ